MRQNTLKIAMIAAGIVAAAVIVFAHVFAMPAPQTSKNAEKSEQSAPAFEKAVGAEAVTAQAVQLNPFMPAALLAVLTVSTDTFARCTRAAHIAVRYFETLFQTFIAPNAP
ncbi:MAG: hypothetical protein MUC38_04465 [Cyclobacteriaceae bacterium]|jgi:hypothetical protein|nr:hypothetical protein [Cyclobacteriaceae bacterium]